MAAWRRWRKRRGRPSALLKAVEAELAAEAARVEAAQAEADFAAHAHDELTRLAARPGEEEALAERRSQMMQAEKVAADIREAHDSLSRRGLADATFSPLPRAGWKGGFPRLRRLSGPACKALDDALEALDAASRRGRGGAARRRFRSS